MYNFAKSADSFCGAFYIIIIMKKTIILMVWFVCFIISVNFGIDLLNERSTLANIIGLFIVGTVIGYSVQTGCFYVFKDKTEKKDEKDNQEN